MSEVGRHIRAAQRRLLFNEWLRTASICSLGAGVLFIAYVAVVRLWDVHLPIGYGALAIEAAALISASIWAAATKPGSKEAAERLDKAAGLKERLSTGLYCAGSDDPFAQAVTVDAERVSRAINVRRQMPLHVPRTAAATGLAWILSPLLLLLPAGMFVPQEKKVMEIQRKEVIQAKQAVKRQFEQLNQLADNNKALKDLKEQLEGMDKPERADLVEPQDVRNEAIKKIERMTDSLREQRESQTQEELEESRKMLRKLETPEEAKTPVDQLRKSLAEGNFEGARKSLESMQQQMATLKQPEDQERIQEMQKQLNELSKALEQAAGDKKLEQQLEQAGLDKETVERALKNLTQKDIEQVKEALEKQGISQEQIERMAEQLQQRQAGAQAMQKMAQAMKQAASAAGAGEMSDAGQKLDMAGEGLSEMEQLEQQMDELTSAIDSLQDMKNQLDKPCANCGGTGCSSCQGGQGKGGTGGQDGEGQGSNGGGQGKLGQGSGGLAGQEETSTGFRKERTKVHTGKGKIVGQFLIDAEQIEGESREQIKTLIEAAERDATDSINRDRIPRQYHNAIKKYFSNLKLLEESAKKEDAEKPADDAESGDKPAEDK